MNTRALERLLNILSDVVAEVAALAFVLWIQFWSGRVPGEVDFSSDWKQLAAPLFYLMLFWGGLFTITGLYRRWATLSRTHQLWTLFSTTLLGTVLLSFLIFGPQFLLSFSEGAPAQIVDNPFLPLLGLYALLFLLMAALNRMLVQLLLRRWMLRGIGADPVALVGLTESGLRLANDLKMTPQLGHHPIGFVAAEGEEPPDLFGEFPVIGTTSHLEKLIDQHKLQGLILTERGTREELFSLLKGLGSKVVPIYVIPDLYDVIAGNFKASLVHGTNLKELFPQNMPPWQVPIKRAIDIVVSILLLILSLPITLLTALAIRMESPGPLFYIQERVGQFGNTFRLAKFRSMCTHAEAGGPQWAQQHDPRVTKVGRIIRTLRIDEIPQFWNVLKGEMSVVGPRPERPHFVEQLREQIPFYSRRLAMRPGITGWAQVRHHYDATIDDVRTKVLYDLHYFENMSLLLDLQIMLRTIWVVLSGKGAR